MELRLSQECPHLVVRGDTDPAEGGLPLRGAHGLESGARSRRQRRRGLPEPQAPPTSERRPPDCRAVSAARVSSLLALRLPLRPEVLVEAGFVADPRCRDALDLLETKRLADGGFPAEARYYRSPAAASNASLVSWGGTSRRRSNPWVTTDALAVPAAANQIDFA